MKASSPSIRVLLADDHDLVRRGTREILLEARPGLIFGEARTTQETLRLVSSDSWDLVVLDINMPGRGGLEVLEQIRRDCPETPVLVVSAYPEEEFAIRSFKLGARGYLTKCSASDELVAAFQKILNGGKYVTATLAEQLVDSVGAPASRKAHENLSQREMQVLQHIAQGKTIKETAAALCLSEKTVGTYRTRISTKLNLSTNVEITRYALLNKLVD